MTPRLYGPIQLTEQRIEEHLVHSPGIYALGYTRNDNFVIAYLGRADADLRTELKMHVRGPYQQFKFTYALSTRDAYEKQCELFHDSSGLENDSHPRPPRGRHFVCPRCGVPLIAERVLTASSRDSSFQV